MKSETNLLRGVVDPDDYSEDELIITSLRVPEALARSIDQALEHFSKTISDREAFILTALAYALCCIEGQQRRA
jgi:hypothetical protein